MGIKVEVVGMKVDLRSRDSAGKQDGSADERGRELHGVGDVVLKVGDVEVFCFDREGLVKCGYMSTLIKAREERKRSEKERPSTPFFVLHPITYRLRARAQFTSLVFLISIAT